MPSYRISPDSPATFKGQGALGAWCGTQDRTLQGGGITDPKNVSPGEKKRPQPSLPGLRGPARDALPPPRDLESVQEASGSAHPGTGRGAEPGSSRRGSEWGRRGSERGIILKLRAAIT